MFQIFESEGVLMGLGLRICHKLYRPYSKGLSKMASGSAGSKNPANLRLLHCKDSNQISKLP